MYKQHPICTIPDENTKIWRFLDFTKFYSLLDKKALHFTRTDKLDDRFEGSIPKSKDQFRIVPAYERLRGMLREEMIAEFQKSPTIHEFLRQMSYICSFHMSDEESAALWKIYLKSNEGVVFQTTIKELIESLNSDDTYEVHISVVNYINYAHETIPVEQNALYPILHKRKSFEYERELRAFVFAPKDIYSDTLEKVTYLNFENTPGISVPVDVESLLIHVRVAPTSSLWFKELVQSLVEKFDLKLTVQQSSLDDEPLF